MRLSSIRNGGAHRPIGLHPDKDAIFWCILNDQIPPPVNIVDSFKSQIMTSGWQHFLLNKKIA